MPYKYNNLNSRRAHLGGARGGAALAALGRAGSAAGDGFALRGLGGPGPAAGALE